MDDGLPVEACLMQYEVIIPTDRKDEFQDQLVALALVLSSVTQTVYPVVTDPNYKLNVATLSVAAHFFNRMLNRVLPKYKQRSHIYESQMGITLNGSSDTSQVSENDQGGRVSDVIITITTRKEFIDRYNNLDTLGLQDRIKWAIPDQNWIVFFLDAEKGLFKTRKGVSDTVEVLLEGAHGSDLEISLDQVDLVRADIPLFTKLEELVEYLIHCGLVDEDLLKVNRNFYVNGIPSADNAHAVPTRTSTEDTKHHTDQNESVGAPPNGPVPTPALEGLDDFYNWVKSQNDISDNDFLFLQSVHDGFVMASDATTLDGLNFHVINIKRAIIHALNGGLNKDLANKCLGALNHFFAIDLYSSKVEIGDFAASTESFGTRGFYDLVGESGWHIPQDTLDSTLAELLPRSPSESYSVRSFP